MNKLITNEFQRIKVTVKSFATFIALQVFEFWRIYGELCEQIEMLQILALYNYLLITKMTDLNYFVRKKIYVQALKKSSKMTLNFHSPISNQVLASLRRKKRVWMKLVSFKQHEKNETEHQWSRTTNWYQQHKKQTKFIEDH